MSRTAASLLREALETVGVRYTFGNRQHVIAAHQQIVNDRLCVRFVDVIPRIACLLFRSQGFCLQRQEFF